MLLNGLTTKNMLHSNMQLMSRTLTRPPRLDRATAIRLHFMPEWAERRGMTQAEISEGLDVNKATVSKWFAGALPSETNLPRIAAMFGIDIDELFRLPEDNWVQNFVRGRSEEERERMKQMLKAAFPDRKTGTNN
jgi:predicted XRE-type DNA-binding protein